MIHIVKDANRSHVVYELAFLQDTRHRVWPSQNYDFLYVWQVDEVLLRLIYDTSFTIPIGTSIMNTKPDDKFITRINEKYLLINGPSTKTDQYMARLFNMRTGLPVTEYVVGDKNWHLYHMCIFANYKPDQEVEILGFLLLVNLSQVVVANTKGNWTVILEGPANFLTGIQATSNTTFNVYTSNDYRDFYGLFISFEVNSFESLGQEGSVGAGADAGAGFQVINSDAGDTIKFLEILE